MGDEEKDIFHCQSISDFIVPHHYFIQPKLRLMLFILDNQWAWFGCIRVIDQAVALYRAEDTFSRVHVLRSIVSSFQNYSATSSDAGLKAGCFLCLTASAQRGKLPWVSWLHMSRMNELNWKTNSWQ